jgi:peptidyl-prolyl cis-trans isomerase A (cyclophilin A)
MRRRTLIASAAALAAAPALAQAPTAPAPAQPPAAATVKVAVTTGAGVFVLELYPDKAPITVANFLRYVDQKRYDGAKLYRAVTAPGIATLGLVQGGLQNDPKKVLPPIKHEPTSKTGIKHTDGVISLARWAEGTATADFFICVGEAPYLDADPSRPGDNTGYAAFGRVVEGMDVVRKVLGYPTSPTKGEGVMKGQMLEPPVPIVTMRRVAT